MNEKKPEYRPGSAAYFPRKYLTDMFDFFQINKDAIEIITYNDFHYSGDQNFKNNYLAEYKSWTRALRNGEVDPRKAHVLIQYDVDTSEHRTMELLREASHQAIPANVMIFNRRIDRKTLKASGNLVFTNYDIDHDLLSKLAKNRFLVGYHTNAMEQALFQPDYALEIFDQDIRALQKHHAVNFFSAHGGITGENGLRNRDIDFHSNWRSDLRWVHNGHTFRFAGSFSDGGHNSTHIPAENRDLRDFVASFLPGKRYRIIIHPQYYDINPKKSKSYSGTPWYEKMMNQYRNSPDVSLWENVRLQSKKRSLLEKIFPK